MPHFIHLDLVLNILIYIYISLFVSKPIPFLRVAARFKRSRQAGHAGTEYGVPVCRCPTGVPARVFGVIRDEGKFKRCKESTPTNASVSDVFLSTSFREAK